MAIRELSFKSANGRDTVKGWVYTPISEPRAIVQLVHGFGEHSRRYIHMISAFQEAGFVVYADDHIGHGKTGVDSGTLGDPGTKGVDGYLTYLKDEKTLHDMAVKDFPGLPFFMFGHSWGSMLGRGYASLYGGDLTGLLLCGVVCQMKGCVEWAHNKDYIEHIEKTGGTQPAGEWMGRVFEGMVDRIENPATGNDWIANDPRVVADHAADPFNSFAVTDQLVFDLAEISYVIDGPDWAKKVPSKLPVYLIAGDCDPCGNYGEGLYHCANMLAENGNPVKVHAYSGYRHEIHNQREIRDEVVGGLVDFIDSVIK